jgi:hypothetical protein
MNKEIITFNIFKEIEKLICSWIGVLLLLGCWTIMAQSPAGFSSGNPAVADPNLLGEWVGENPNDGQIMHLVFTANGVIALQQAVGSQIGRYSVDLSSSPAYLNIHWNDNTEGGAIYEIIGQELRIEQGGAQHRPQHFGRNAVTLKKSDSVLQTKLLGEWIVTDPENGHLIYFTFAQNGVFDVLYRGDSTEEAYSVDWTKSPPYLDIKGSGSVEKTIFQFTDAGILVGDVDGQTRPTNFTDKAMLLKRANDVISQFPLATDPSLCGDWVGEDPKDGEVLHFVFTPNGAVELQQASGWHKGTYSVDLTEPPAYLNIHWDDNSGLKAIYQTNDQELHIECGDVKTRPQSFSDGALVLKKADSAFLKKLQGSWVGGNFAGQISLITFASGGIIKSAEKGQSKEGTYSVDGNTNPACLDIKWGSDDVDKCVCRFQSITNKNTDVPFKDILIIQEGRGQDLSPQLILGIKPYRRASAEDINKLSAILQLGQYQPQATPTNPIEK